MIRSLHKQFSRRTLHLIRSKNLYASRCCSSASASNSSAVHPADKTGKRPISLSKPADKYGQPTPQSHPHLLRPGQLVAEITAKECSERRHRVMESIQKYALASDPQLASHVAIVPSANKRYMSDKIPYVFRQNSDFMYLTGCLEPDTTLVMWIDATKSIRSAMFMNPKDAHAELWDGPRTGVDNAVAMFAVDESYAASELLSFLKKFPKPFSLWYNQKNSDLDRVSNTVSEFMRDVQLTKTESPTIFVQQQRLIKSSGEIELMRRTCHIASVAINETMQETRPNDSEHHVFARVDYKCRMAGASFLAYPPVVAAGSNATIIHYVQNTQLARAGEMILMDAGCEYGGYSSDITRTWPVDGNFTDAQRVLYEVIYLLQKDLIATMLKDGGQTLDALFDTMCLRLGQLLQEAGLLKRTLTGIDLSRAAFKFCPHHVSHYLGMDVHDTPLMSRQRLLLPGMVCTVEPGMYIATDCKDVPAEFRGIGIRIEDDVLITSDRKVEVLTDECVKDPSALQELCAAHH